MVVKTFDDSDYAFSVGPSSDVDDDEALFDSCPSDMGAAEREAADMQHERELAAAKIDSQTSRDAAEKLVALDYDVASWSRSPKDVAGVTSFHGADGL